MSQSKSFSLILLYDKISLSLPVAQALKEKNIDVHIAQNAGELIQSIAAKNVDMVGLSVNHTSTRSLIQVLREKTRVKILIFGEDKSPATAERVERLDADFKVNGVATAYNVWMKIAQAVKFKMKEADSNGSILYSGGGKGSSQKQEAAIVVKSGKHEKNERSSAEIVSLSKKKKKSKSQSVDVTNNDLISFQQPKEEKQEIAFFKKDESGTEKKTSLFKKSASAKKQRNKSDEQLIEDEVSALETMFKDPYKKKSRDLVDVEKESKEASAQGGVAVDEADVEVNPNPDVDLNKMQVEENGEPGQVWQTEEEKELENGKVIQFDKKKKNKDGKKGNRSKNQEGVQALESEEGTRQPFKEIVESAAYSSYVAKESSVNAFGPINKMTIVPVDKNRDRGFLIFCTSDNQFVTTGGTPIEAFKKSLQDRLDQSEAIGVGESYNIETEEIDVQSWVQNGSDFYVIVEDPKSQKEILICFISKEAIYPDTNKSIELNMLKVELDVIPALTPINFNIFLYFARNKRLIPYLRRGGKITEAQMQRLGKHGIDTVYIAEADRKALYSFFISQTIHQDLRPIKKSA